jgi:hypothetical protein
MLSGTQKAYFHFIQQEARTSNDAVLPGNTRAPRSFQRSLLEIHAITTLNSGTFTHINGSTLDVELLLVPCS